MSELASMLRGRARAARDGDPVAAVLQLPRGRSGYARYERVRAAGDLVRGRGRLYMSASHATCGEVLRGRQFGAVPTAAAKLRLTPPRGQRSALLVHPLDDSFASVDPPEHTRLRRIVAPWFTTAAMKARAGFVERVVEDELDRLDRPGTVDLIDEFALRVPSRVICELLGLPPADHERFCRWGLEFGTLVDGARNPGEVRRTRTLLSEMADYFDGQAALRRREPGRDDLLEVLVRAVDQGEMTEAGMLATAEALLIGGFVTTSNIIGNAVVALDAAPGQREEFLSAPGQAARVVEEVLRLDAPAQYSVRVANEAVTLAGVDLPAGSVVVTLLAAANRDPGVFADPARFDFTRPNVRDHLSFAAGVHYCIGAGLARLEGEIALRSLYSRFPRLSQAGRARYCPSRVIRGPRLLPVTTRGAR